MKKLIMAAMLAVVLVSGCKSGAIKDAITQGTEIAGQIEAQKAAERAAKEKAEEDRIAAEKEAERIRNEPPHWSAAEGAPETLTEGARYKIKRDGETWYFAYQGGVGLYKPESSLWLVNVKAAQVKTAGEYAPDGRVIKWFRIGGNSEPRADGNQTNGDLPGYYHSNQLKLRDAKATASGNTFRAILTDGRVIEKTIVDRNVRQE